MYLVTYHNPLDGVHQKIMFVSETQSEARDALFPCLEEQDYYGLLILHVNRGTGERYVIHEVEKR